MAGTRLVLELHADWHGRGELCSGHGAGDGAVGAAAGGQEGGAAGSQRLEPGLSTPWQAGGSHRRQGASSPTPTSCESRPANRQLSAHTIPAAAPIPVQREGQAG